MKGLRNAFFSGFVLLAPLGVTIFVVQFLLDKIGGRAGQLIFSPFLDVETMKIPMVNFSIQLVSTIIVVIIITLIGYLSNYFMGKFFLRVFERVIDRLPFISTVYNTVKQIVDTFSKQKESVFQKTVLVEYPRRGAWALGFLTGVAKGEVQSKTHETSVNVFVPTTPNPTSGFLLMIPREEVVDMDMTVADGMKLIISGGAVVPPYGDQARGLEADRPVDLENPREDKLDTPSS